MRTMKSAFVRGLCRRSLLSSHYRDWEKQEKRTTIMADTTNDDALNGTSEAFIDELSTQLWALVNVAPTGKWINPRFSQLLPSLAIITGLLASLEFSFCPGLEEIFGSFVPPASSWFKFLPLRLGSSPSPVLPTSVARCGVCIVLCSTKKAIPTISMLAPGLPSSKAFALG